MPHLLPTPVQLFRLFENGDITRAQLQAAMSMHQHHLMIEIAEARRNPLAAYVDDRLSKRAAHRLERRHGERFVRLVLSALGEIPGFPPSNLLWNAGHRDVPLHCFLRVRREPVFRVIRIDTHPVVVKVLVEHGAARKRDTTREEITFRRNRFGKLCLQSRDAKLETPRFRF
ncbi:MAG: hypothetical protein HKN82_06500 [Akkermansiaceae bacterium]|nr:hypothetical protein [Akkermansiaceae bacterium]